MSQINNDLIKTGVDDLLELLKKVNKISLTDASDQLKVSTTLVQSWVDFLVEEEIVGIEYKFTKPLIYLNKEPTKDKPKQLDDSEVTIQTFKDDFWKRAAAKQIPEDKVGFFWKNHLLEVCETKKEFFIREAKKRKLDSTENLWEEFKNDITML